MIKVCHMTSVHSRQDTRIFVRQCRSLHKAGYDVTLIAENDRDEVIEGIKICGVDKEKKRLARMAGTTRQIYKRAVECDADIYHFHDPELIPLGMYLKQKGKKVVYDVHEDLPRDIYYKPWIPRHFRGPISRLAETIEAWAAKRLDAVITSTPYIAERFRGLTDLAVDIKNYPLLQEDIAPVEWNAKEENISYISSIFIIERAVREVIKAMESVEAGLTLAGRLEESLRDKQLSELPGWEKVSYLGWVDRGQVVEIMKKSRAGLSLYYPTATYLYAIPTKMFEYMMAGIPVIASNLPYETEIINKYRCGICVDPYHPEQIAEAMNWVLNNPEQAEEMGRNGRYAIENEFNWATEEKKLLALYNELLR
ncbi:MAG: glycosyltransferase family 4 protein [Syntrophomonadaceae bacterium]|nr:glycosyltransferase family 4 protein [Syntrophomonadaceae bacterium]